MARAPNYDFERKERERLKKLKNAERAESKLQRTIADPEADASDQGTTEK